MKKEKAIKIITDCAKIYNENLENKNLLFIFGAEKSPEFFEASFLPRNFLHLTGVKISEDRIFGSVDFYEKCLRGKLSPSDFSFAQDGTTDMKIIHTATTHGNSDLRKNGRCLRLHKICIVHRKTRRKYLCLHGIYKRK